MPNMSPQKNPMPVQDPLVRSHNFDEVAKGYTRRMAMDEADRCARRHLNAARLFYPL